MRVASIRIASTFTCAVCLAFQGQVAPPKDEGIPPRTAPSDYEFHAQAGALTVAAEFTGHSVATPEGTLTTDEYVVVELAVYGPAGARTKLSPEDFSLRINRKKPEMGQAYEFVVRTLRDLEAEPTATEQKSKTSIGTGGQSEGNSTPPPYRVPDATRHEWRQRLQKISLPEGDRLLPKAGLIYFPYRGKTDKIQSIELIYAGPAGKCTMALQAR